MDKEQLARKIFQHGDFIEAVEYYGQRACLYVVDQDFFEVYYSLEENQIVKVNVAGTAQLTKYLHKITLPDHNSDSSIGR